jgi:hypothetical protein
MIGRLSTPSAESEVKPSLNHQIALILESYCDTIEGGIWTCGDGWTRAERFECLLEIGFCIVDCLDLER